MKRILIISSFMLIVDSCSAMHALENQIYNLITPKMTLESVYQQVEQTQDLVNQQLAAFINCDELRGVQEIIKYYDQSYELRHPENCLINTSYQRIQAFARLNNTGQPMRPDIKNIFNQRRHTAYSILELLKAHRDKAFFKAIDVIDKEMIFNYLASGARINWEDKYGRNAFHHLLETVEREHACFPANSRNLTDLMEIKNALIHRRGKVLLSAIYTGNYRLATEMVKLGATPDVHNPQGETALEVAHNMMIQSPQNQQRASIYNFLTRVATRYAQGLQSPAKNAYSATPVLPRQFETEREEADTEIVQLFNQMGIFDPATT